MAPIVYVLAVLVVVVLVASVVWDLSDKRPRNRNRTRS